MNKLPGIFFQMQRINTVFWKAIARGDCDAVQACVVHGADVNQLLKAGACPSSHRYREECQENLCFTSAVDMYPLGLATIMGDCHMIRRLLRLGSRHIDGPTWMMSPLHLAILYNQFNALYLLLRSGAKWETVDSRGKSLIDFARERKNRPAAVLLQTLSRSQGYESSLEILAQVATI